MTATPFHCTHCPDGLNSPADTTDAEPAPADEVLPRYLLSLLDMRLYCSTACDTAGACENAADDNPEHARLLRDHAARLHTRCRRTHKFTGAPCICSCHRKETTP